MNQGQSARSLKRDSRIDERLQQYPVELTVSHDQRAVRPRHDRNPRGERIGKGIPDIAHNTCKRCIKR